MIDTDKYKGHTPAPWRTAEGQPYDDEGSHLDIVDANGVLVTETSYFTDNDHPNAQLIADAPLLLVEVKKLREENETLRKMDWEYECLWTWLAENTNLLNTIEPLMEEWKKEMIE